VYIGTKGDGRAQAPGTDPSIPVLVIDDDTGSLERLHHDTGHLPAPSWLCLPPERPPRFLYAACRAEALGDDAPPPTGVGSDDPEDHFVVAFDIDRRTGHLRQINQQPTVGVGPTHCSASGSMLVTAQYVGGSVTAFGCAADGSLLPTRCVTTHKFSSGANATRQSSSYCHGWGDVFI
jgi:6-phosphogluconolactonase (cycloisomerase 2 family)